MEPSIVFDVQASTVTPRGTSYFIEVWVRSPEKEQLVHRTDQECDRAGSRMHWLRSLARRLEPLGITLSAEQLDIQLLAALEKYRLDHPETCEVDLDPGDPLAATAPEIRQEAEDLLGDPDLIQRIRDDIAYLGVAGESDSALMIYLAATSRLLASPLAVLVAGASSSGKSYVLNKVARMMPPEAILQAHTLTPECLYYLPPGSLEHKALFAGERVQRNGEAEAASKALREGLSDGRLVKLVTIRDRRSGELVTRRIEQTGPWAYFESTTASSIGQETATRLLVLTPDESADQTARVMERLSREAAGAFSLTKQQRILAVHQCLQRLLDPMPVMIPWADRLHLPEARPSTRRTFGHLLGVIRAVALLRQRQHDIRDGAEGPCLVADAIDYAIARQLVGGIFLRQYDPVPAQSRQLLAELQVQFAVGETFTLQQITGPSADVSHKQLRRRMDPLVQAGLAGVATQSRPYMYNLTGQDVSIPDLGLPDAEVIAAALAECQSG